MLARILTDKRLVLTVLVSAAIAIYFWSQSRIPALNEKAMMGGDTEIEALGFDQVYPVKADDPAWTKILKTTANWVQTNRKGMIFGVIFAACLMTLFSLFEKRSFKNRFANSALGMVIGAPLGVCVNCAAPIARGLQSGGARAETTLAAMIASPTLNFIVLSMLFALFPLYLVTIKLLFTFLAILLLVPLLTRWFGRDIMLPSDDAACPLPKTGSERGPAGEGWFASVGWFLKSFGKNLWFLAKRTVPLMLVAGFLGAVLITYVPWESFESILPTGNKAAILLGMGILALIGITLPVPISFDVIVVAILIAGGMPVRYAMVLLFTLGVFSLYSFFIVWTGVSRKIAVALMLGLALMGVAAGVAADQWWKYDKAKEREALFAMFGAGSASRGPSEIALPPAEARAPVMPEALGREPFAATGDAGITVERSALRAREQGTGTHFTRFEGGALGLEESMAVTALQYTAVGRFRSIAAGDVHGDGWPDLLFGTEHGFVLYANEGGKRFTRQAVDVPGLDAMVVVNAALVDLSGDGWLDIVYAAYGEGVHLLTNSNGQFSASRSTRIPNHDAALMPGGMAFGDVDEDGDLDVYLGNWTVGEFGQMRASRGWVSASQNALVVNDGGTFRLTTIPGFVGETLSTLFSDLNGDGHLDLFVGNDFKPPDDYYFGDGKGGFRRLVDADGLFPISTRTTMSLSTGDVDNDLKPELYLGQITGRFGGSKLELLEATPEICAEIVDAKYRSHCESILAMHGRMTQAIRTRDIGICDKIDPRFKEDCMAVILLHDSTRWSQDRDLCKLFKGGWKRFEAVCGLTFSERIQIPEAELSAAIQDTDRGENVLLTPTSEGRFENVAKARGVHVTGWTWNAKFADVDNDGWQDLYVVNGEYLTTMRESNVFYRNDGAGKFKDATKDFGLRSFLPTSGYAYVDWDQDGDLDIVSTPVPGPVLAYRNDGATGNSIAVELRDHRGNRFGIGCKVTVHLAGGKRQVRELQASGGFVSFDPPVAHFGLGSADTVEKLEVAWSTGGTSTLTGPFPANSVYRITRDPRP